MVTKIIEYKIEMPEEYKREKTFFLNCRINLKKKVFIPRQETEWWVKKAIENCSSLIKDTKLTKPKFLDMFAGSGCIGIAILKNIKNSFVDFADIDKRAIEQINFNLKLNGISQKRYKVYRSNLFEKLKEKKYHFIFANPPYVAKERIGEVQKSVILYEPKKAILGGKGGFYYIKKFLNLAKTHLTEKGKIFMEFDPFQKIEIEKILKKEGYKNFIFFKDQFKKFRFLRVDK